MIVRLLILCVLIIVLVYLVKQFRRQTPHHRNIMGWQIVLGIVALMLILLAATGRIHWIGAIFATLIAFFRQLTPLLIKSFPVLKHLYQQYTYQQRHNQQHNRQHGQQRSEQTHHSATNTVNSERKAAYKILGLEEGASRDEIIQAHRKLMQKVHPDRGGSAELAAQVNRAKDILLG